MDLVVLKTNTNKIFTIQEFEMMTNLERESYRGNIECIKCGAEAYYRKVSKDGKVACFGAKHPGCEAASGHHSSNDVGNEDTNEVKFAADFEIAWNYDGKKKGTNPNEDGDNKNFSEGLSRKKYVNKPELEKQKHISLGAILRYAEYGVIDKQNYVVKLPGAGMRKLKDMVVKLEDIRDYNIGQALFMWGSIKQFSKMWINTPYKNKISIRVDEIIQDNFWSINQEKIKKLLYDKNCIIIVYGKVKKSKSGNYYINLYDTKYFLTRKEKTL